MEEAVQCCQTIFQKVAQTGVKRRTNALPRRAHFCVFNLAYKIGKNVLKLVFSNMLHLQNTFPRQKIGKSPHVTEIFLTISVPKRKDEYQKGPFSEHFSPSILKKAKNISLSFVALSNGFVHVCRSKLRRSYVTDN